MILHLNNIKILFILYFVIFSTITEAQILQQDKVAFTYDAAGNRIKRTRIGILEEDPGNPNMRMQNETTIVLSEPKDTILVSAYPNPVSSDLNIYFELLPPKADVTIKVTDYSGREMLNIKQTQTTENLNLEGFATGIYIVNITINNKPKLLKVIKQ